MMVAHGVSGNDVFEAFGQFDIDHNGVVDFFEFRTAILERLCLQLNNRELREVWGSIDLNHSGSIDYSEFAGAMFPDTEVFEAPKPRPSNGHNGNNRRTGPFSKAMNRMSRGMSRGDIRRPTSCAEKSARCTAASSASSCSGSSACLATATAGESGGDRTLCAGAPGATTPPRNCGFENPLAC
eukprot:5407611-Prymnesium_polylepis.1